MELSLAPLYLYAAYSIKDPSSLAARLIISVAAEEMLHATLDANMLVAIGGRPVFSDPGTAPAYPMVMPHHKPPIMLELRPASVEVMDLFCTIEKPRPGEALPEDDDYETQGQFYGAIAEAFEHFSADELFAANDLNRQLGDPSYYTAVEFDADDSGGLELIRDMDGVRRALSTVIHQGEGLSDERWADPAHQELTHYYKLLRIYDGESPLGEVKPLRTNPRTSQYPDHVRPVSDLFNAAYRYIYLTMARLFSPGEKKKVVDDLYGLMIDVLAPVARHMTVLELGDGTYAGPTFEVIDLGADPEVELTAMSASVATTNPELTSVAEWFSART